MKNKSLMWFYFISAMFGPVCLKMLKNIYFGGKVERATIGKEEGDWKAKSNYRNYNQKLQIVLEV